MNVSMFTGHLGRDPELRHTPSGTAVLGFSVAVRNGFRRKDQTQESPAIWKACTLWGDRGEKVAKFLTKGAKVTIVATESEEHYKSKEGEDKSRLKYTISYIEIHKAPASNSESTPVPAPAGNPDDIEEDVPF